MEWSVCGTLVLCIYFHHFIKSLLKIMNAASIWRLDIVINYRTWKDDCAPEIESTRGKSLSHLLHNFCEFFWLGNDKSGASSTVKTYGYLDKTYCVSVIAPVIAPLGYCINSVVVIIQVWQDFIQKCPKFRNLGFCFRGGLLWNVKLFKFLKFLAERFHAVMFSHIECSC